MTTDKRPRCMHAAPPGECAFKGCKHFRPDGPRDEKWAFRPGTTQEDIDLGMKENAAQHKRAPGTASPIHMVVEKYRQRRTGELQEPPREPMISPWRPKMEPTIPTMKEEPKPLVCAVCEKESTEEAGPVQLRNVSVYKAGKRVQLTEEPMPLHSGCVAPAIQKLQAPPPEKKIEA